MTHTQTGAHTPTSASTSAQTRVHTHDAQAHMPEHTPAQAGTHTGEDTQAHTHVRTRTRKPLIVREDDAIAGPSTRTRGSHITIVIDGLYTRYVLSIYSRPLNENGYGWSDIKIGERRFTRAEVIKRRKEEYLKAKYGRS